MKKVDIFKNGVDCGYLGNNQKWWFDENFENSFELFDLDGFYSEDYFKNDHVRAETVNNYVFYVKHFYKKLLNKDLESVFEAGAGGGWFTKKFMLENVEVFSLEGSKCGYDACLKRGIPESVIHMHDLRKPFNMHRKFDIVCCTEVGEHIETPFSSQLIQTLTDHSDLVWFSFESPGTNLAHYHHCNEQPEKFWVNIFKFFGYGFIKIPSEIYRKYELRGTHIFYNTKKFKEDNGILQNI